MLTRYSPYQTCYRCFQNLRKEGVFGRILLAFAEDLCERGRIDPREAFIDGTFAPAKKEAPQWENKRGKGIKIMAEADASGLPATVYMASVSPNEVTLVEQPLTIGGLNEIQARLIGDKAYDSNGLD